MQMARRQPAAPSAVMSKIPGVSGSYDGPKAPQLGEDPFSKFLIFCTVVTREAAGT
jgi:hypothetical protein